MHERQPASHSLMRWLFLGATALAAVGCTPLRAVTHLAPSSSPDGDVLYVAHTEDGVVAKLRRCAVRTDNTLDCKDEKAVNAFLDGTSSAPSK